MFKPAAILACGLALLAGCTDTPPGKSRSAANQRPPDWERVPQEKPNSDLPIPPPTNALPALETAGPPSVPSAPERKWISLNRWREERGVGEMRRLRAPPKETFALPTTNGVLIITVGSQTAYWDRLELRLGFAPQNIDGRVFVHALDVRKNFEPLLATFSLPARSNRVVVIDPGHGGSNLGARSVVDGRWEKEYTLDWARRLAPLLEQVGWQVFLTRTNDLDVSLSNRAAFAEQHHADFFLSLHLNSPGDNGHEASGLETYCLTPAGMPSTVTRGFRDDVSETFPNNTFDQANLLYAVRLHREMLKVNGHDDRGVRRARFPGVLRGQRCPAVLLEGGYLSNPREARRIADPAYRQKLAEAIAAALQ